MPPSLSIELLDETRKLPESALAWLVERVRMAAAVLGVGGEVRVRVIDDDAMAKAHEEFAGVPGTTDVLTFDMSDPEEAGPQPGEAGIRRALGTRHLAPGPEDATSAQGAVPSAPSPGPPSRTSDSQNVRNVYNLDTDVLVCLDEAQRQSGLGTADGGVPGGGRGYPVEAELLLYVVHGMLHCLGLDDHEEDQSAQMHQFEDAVLEAIGVGRVFRRDGE